LGAAVISSYSNEFHPPVNQSIPLYLYYIIWR